MSGSTSSTATLSAIALPRAASRRSSSSDTVSLSRRTSATRTFLPSAASAALRIGGDLANRNLAPRVVEERLDVLEGCAGQCGLLHVSL